MQKATEDGAYVKEIDQLISFLELECSTIPKCIVTSTINRMRRALGDPLSMIETRVHVRRGALLISMTVRM